MGRAFRRYVPKTPGVDEDSLAPQTHGIGVLILVEGAFAADEEPPIDPPASLERLARHLARISPFQKALAESTLGIYWSPTGSTEAQIASDLGLVDPDLTPRWVLSQLVGASLDELGLVLTAGRHLPYVVPGVDLLVVVMSEGVIGEPPGHSSDVGPYPYVVWIPEPRMRLSGSGPEAEAVAKAIGKTLGLGEEGTDPEFLAAPDFWGRAFPNLWVPPIQTIQLDPTDTAAPTGSGDDPPWFDGYPIQTDGGFGFATGVTRPTDSCLMGDPTTAGRSFCDVCLNYLTGQLVGSEQHLEATPELTLSADGVLGAVEVAGNRLWDSITIERLVLTDSGWEVGQASSVAQEDVRRTVASYVDLVDVAVDVEDHLSTLGRSVVLSLTLDATRYYGLESPDSGGMAEEADSIAPAGDDAPDESASESTTSADEHGGGEVNLDDVAVARWVIAGGFVDETTTDPWFWWKAEMQEHGRRLTSAWTDQPDLRSSHEIVLKSHNWWLTAEADEAEQPPFAVGFSAPMTLADDEPDPRPWLSFSATTANSRRVSRARLWPSPLQGESATLLPRVLAMRQAPLESAAARELGIMGDLAYLQCVGVPERGPRQRNTRSHYYRGTGRIYLQLMAEKRGRAPSVVEWQWHEDQVPVQLRRLVELVDPDTPAAVESGGSNGLPGQWDELQRVRELTTVEPEVRDKASALKAAMERVQNIYIIGWRQGEAYERVLMPLATTAVHGQTEQLLSMYPGDLFADLLAIPTGQLGRRALWARARAFTKPNASLSFGLGTRSTGFTYDRPALLRQARKLERPDLHEMQTVGQAAALWPLLVAWSPDLASAYEFAQLLMQLAVQIGRSDDGAYSAYLDGAGGLWNAAVNDYVRLKSPSDKAMAASRALLETPPELRESLASAFTPPAGAAALYALVGRSDEELLGHAVSMVVAGQLSAEAAEDAIGVLTAAGALLGARQGAVDHLDEIIEQLNESAQPDMAQLNHFTDARVAAIAANDSAISLIKTPNQAGVPSLSFDVTGNKLAELQAKAKTRFGLDDGAEAAHRLAQLTEHTQVIDSFSKLTYELMVAVDQHTTFVARKNQMTDSGRAAIDAIKALNAPDADALPASVADAHRVDLAIHWGGVFASHPNAAQWRPHTLDEKMARLVGAMRTVPDGALNDDPRFNDIRSQFAGWSGSNIFDAVVSTAAGGSNDRMVFPLGGNGSPSGGEPEAGLGAAVRSIAVLAPYQDLPARIKNPQVYSEYLKIWLAGLSETVGVGSETITLDGHGLMRAALAWEHNPSLFSPTTSESDEFVVRHAAVNTLLADSVADRRIGLDAAEMIRDVMYGSPAVDSLKSSAGHGVRNMELAYFELRLTRLALERGWQGVLFYDAVSNAGPEMDEAIALFQLAMGRIRLNNASGDGALLTIRQDDYAMAIELATDARARMNDYVESRHETAVMAAGLAGAAAGIGISLLPLGAPLGMTIVMASLGAGVASVATYEIIEGPSYTTTNEQTETFLAGALEGMIDAAVGGLVGAGSLAFKARQAGAVAAAAGQGVRATQATTSATSRLLGTLATGAIEGTASGTIMAVGQTALDQATWDQTTLNVMARFVRQALIGGLMGLAMGTAFSVPQSLIDALGEERARKVFEWLTQRGQTGVVGQLDEFDPTGHQAKQLLDEADDLRREGMIDDAEAKLRQIDEDVLSTPLGLTDSLLGPADRARGSARAGLEELQARGAANLSNTTVAEFLDAVSFDDLPSAQMPMRSESAAYIRLESFDPPDFRTVMDAEADMPVLREEVLHVYEVWKGPPSSRALGERLLASRLDRLWTPNGPDWSPYSNSDGLLGERLDALDAYLRLEQINQQQMLDSFPHDTTLEVSEDGFVSSDLDEDHLQAMLLIEEHSVVDLYQRTALDALLTDVDANPGRLDSYDMVFMQQFDLDEPLHLTSRTRPRPKIKRVCEARGDMTRADYDAAFADADLSTIFDLDGFQDTTLTGPRPITKQWRRRFFNPDTQETVHMVMVGGAKRFKLSEVNGQTLLAENVDRDAFFHDLPEWLDYRSDLIDHLMAGFAVTNPRGIGVGTDELANQRALAVHMVDAMGREPLGFVYGTSPLRVFAYDSQYRKLVVGADTVDGAEVFRAFAEHISTGQRHHFRPIFTLSRDHLALERFGSVDMTMAMVDLPRPVHTSIHRLYNGMERQPATGARANFNPTSMRYAALELGVHDDGIFPAMSLLESSGRMRWAQFRGSDFAPLTMTPGPEIEVPE